MKREKPRLKKYLTAEVSAKQSIKRQFHTTHVGAVGWEPHSSSTTTCTGKVGHELESLRRKGKIGKVLGGSSKGFGSVRKSLSCL